MPGCRNVRAGGDTTIPDQSTLDGQLPPVYMIYVVYRSFKYPPAVKLMMYIWMCKYGKVTLGPMMA